MDETNILIKMEEPFWLLEAVQCLGGVYVLDTDEWLNQNSRWSRAKKEAFLAPYRHYRDAMRAALQPVFTQYPMVMRYIDTVPRKPESLDSEEPPLLPFLRLLQDVIEAEEAPAPEQLMNTVNRVFEKLLDTDRQKSPDASDPVIHSLADVLQTLETWEGNDSDKLKLVCLYSDSADLITQLRLLQRESAQTGRQCLPLVQKRYDAWKDQLISIHTPQQLMETVGTALLADPSYCQIYPAILSYNSIFMDAQTQKESDLKPDCKTAPKNGNDAPLKIRMHIGLELFYMLQDNRNAPYHDTHLLTCLKALGDPARLKILHFLAEKPCYLQELAKALDLTPATVSHHLGILISADLIVMQVKADKRKVYYELVKETIANTAKEVGLLALSRREQEELVQTGKERKKWTILEQ